MHWVAGKCNVEEVLEQSGEGIEQGEVLGIREAHLCKWCREWWQMKMEQDAKKKGCKKKGKARWVPSGDHGDNRDYEKE